MYDPPEFQRFLRDWQDRVTEALQQFEPSARFAEEQWERPGGGGGLTRVLEGGDVFERAGVNFSDVGGPLPDGLRHLPGSGETFRAYGVSIVIHPRSPMMPTVHANYRCISRGGRSFLGGGADLTPWYLFEEDARHFHQCHKEACDPFGTHWYPELKAACDRYFRLPHREEQRGVGGVFFDQLEVEPGLSIALAEAFLPAYLPLVERRLSEPWGPRERAHQLLRRGRYVEFNLVWDKGTHFGLQTRGRTESILMSLPPEVRWHSAAEPEAGSREAALLEVLRTPREWA